MSTLTEEERQQRLREVQDLLSRLNPETGRPYTVPQIAEKLDVSRQAMWQFVRRHKLVLGKRNPLTPSFKEAERRKTEQRRRERVRARCAGEARA